MTQRLSSPIRANFEITEACPLACTHCYTYWGFASTGKRMSKDTSRRTLQSLLEVLNVLIEQRIQVITFTGGEPLTRRDLLFPFIETAKKAGMRVLVNTSGAMITARDVERFTELKTDGFLVSLMSANENVHNSLAHANSFSRTMRGITSLVEAGHTVTVNMVCSTENVKDVRKTAEVLSNVGVAMFAATPVLPTPGNPHSAHLHLSASEMRQLMMDLAWARDNLSMRVSTLDPVVHCQFNQEERDLLGDLLTQRYCCAGISDCAVSPDGNLRACIMSSENVGNIVKDGWDASWAALDKWGSKAILPKECQECDLVDQCGGGCRVASEALNGRINSPDPYMRGKVEGCALKSKSFQKPPRVDANLMLAFDDETSMRPEAFGGSLFNRSNATFVKKEVYELLEEQKRLGSFSASDWVSKYHLEEETVVSFLATLLAGGFIRVANQRKGGRANAQA